MTDATVNAELSLVSPLSAIPGSDARSFGGADDVNAEDDHEDVMSMPPRDMPAALKILKALKDVQHIPCIGYCPTREEAQLRKMGRFSGAPEELDYSDDPDHEPDEEGPREPTKGTLGKQHNAVSNVHDQTHCGASGAV
ncbi:hypothetical protein NUW54_g13054 [Trametes sanguinea]|uniref:Uncharacterized protein n=1 Tax=Trametes sanguinea TaxID=158606 RepID=A0ACC1MQU6_9APHY|nr:hypothetical protein NUW54_g13054 [Trametes sanguinea]